MVVADLGRIALGRDVTRDLLHRPRPVERDAGDDILERFRSQLFHEAGHAGALQLEDRFRPPLADHLVDSRIVHRDAVVVDRGTVVLMGHDRRVAQHCQRPKSQEIELEQPDQLDVVLGKLNHDSIFVSRQRRQVGQRLVGDDHAGGMGRGMARHAFEPPDQVEDHAGRLVLGVFLAEVGIGVHGLGQGHPRRGRDHLGQPVGFRIRHVQGAGDIPDAGPGSQRAERDHLGDMVVSVFLSDIIDHFLAALIAEVDVKVRHADPVGIEKAFEYQGILQGVDVGDAQAPGRQGAGAGAASRPDHDRTAACKANEVPDDQVIVRVAHLADHAQFVIQAPLIFGAQHRPGDLQAFFKPLQAKLTQGAVVGLSRRNGKLRQMDRIEIKRDLAALRDPDRVGDGLRHSRERFGHLFG